MRVADLGDEGSASWRSAMISWSAPSSAESAAAFQSRRK